MSAAKQESIFSQAPAIQPMPEQSEDAQCWVGPSQDVSEGPVMYGSMKDLASLAMKMVTIMGEVGHQDKTGKNDFHNYNYFEAQQVLASLNKACRFHKVACIPRFNKIDEVTKTQRSGQIARLVTVSVDIYLVDAETGASMVIRALGTGEDPGDKATAKAQTTALKYALLSACLISTGDDPEADTATDDGNLPAKTVVCGKCGAKAFKIGESDFDGVAVEIYKCQGCKKETRQKA